MEGILLRLRIISAPFHDIRKGDFKFYNRVLNVFVVTFLFLDFSKYVTLCYLDESSPWNLTLGGPFTKVGNIRRCIYVIVFMMMLCDIICRITIFFRETQNHIEFIFIPLDFISMNHAKSCKSIENFKTASHKFASTAHKQFTLRYLLANGYVMYASILAVMEYGWSFAPSFMILGASCYLISSYFYIKGFVFTSCLWKTATVYLKMKFELIKIETQSLTDQYEFRSNELQKRFRSLMKDWSHTVKCLASFNDSLKWFVFATLISMTPTSCFLITSSFFGKYDSSKQLLRFLNFILIFVIIHQGIDPIYRTSQVNSIKASLVPIFHNLFVRRNQFINTKQKRQLLLLIDHCSADIDQATLTDSFGIAFNPSAFYAVSILSFSFPFTLGSAMI
jgi:hypothetical protein